MASYLYLDANSLYYSHAAGGGTLIYQQIQYAQIRGFTPVITDVVRSEIIAGPGGPERIAALEARGVATVASLEFNQYTAYQQALAAGLPTGEYNPTNAGDRSIAEVAGSRLQAGDRVAIFSDDKFFINSGQLELPCGPPHLKVRTHDFSVQSTPAARRRDP